MSQLINKQYKNYDKVSRYSILSFADSRFAIVLLPLPEGPSSAILIILSIVITSKNYYTKYLQ